jgi:hypothetical protein
MAESNVNQGSGGGEPWERDDIEGRRQFLSTKHRLDGQVFVDGGDETTKTCEHTPEEDPMKRRDREEECESTDDDTAAEDEKIAQFMQVAHSIIDAMMWRAEVGRRNAVAQAGAVKRETPCAVCSRMETPPKRCAGCKTVYYCSRKCQQQDWSSHRRDCLEQQQRHQAAAADVNSGVAVSRGLNK